MMITINDDVCAIVDAERDFPYFVEKYMGIEAREVYDRILENKYSELSSLEDRILSLEDELRYLSEE